MSILRILAAAVALLAAAGAADASAARRRDRHPGHHPRASTATYTMPARPARVLRTAHRTRDAGVARMAGNAGADVRSPSHRLPTRRLAQLGRHHPLMRGS